MIALAQQVVTLDATPIGDRVAIAGIILLVIGFGSAWVLYALDWTPAAYVMFGLGVIGVLAFVLAVAVLPIAAGPLS